jgi:peptide/nickel transport system permease protein
MWRHVLRRVVVSIPVLFGVTLATYVIVNLAPGDPLMAMINIQDAGELGPDYIEQQREELGLNKPVVVRYGLWLGEILKGNLGYSLIDRQPIADKFQDRLWPTFKLMSTSLALALLVSIPVGVLSAIRQYSLIDYVVTVFSFAGVAIPNFFLALGGIFIFALTLDWLPTANMTTIGQPPSLIDSLHHLVLPATILGLSEAAPLIRYVRSSMLEVIKLDYVTVARSKGLHERAVVYRHALRNALIPFVTIVALGLPRLLGGAVIIETIFAWPGIGLLAITAVGQRDYPVIMAINLMIATLIVLSNLLADLLYAVIDPRIRYA